MDDFVRCRFSVPNSGKYGWKTRRVSYLNREVVRTNKCMTRLITCSTAD